MDLFTIAVIGESGVGKTSIITRYMFSKFTGDYSSTIEDFYSTVVRINNSEIKPASFEYPVSVQYDQYKLDVVDTAGTDEFKSVRENSLKNKDGYIFVFHVAEPSSLRNIDITLDTIA